MNELIPINYNEEQPTVSGRDLHNFLEVDTKYADWIKRMFEYGFTEEIDYISCFSNLGSGQQGGQNKIDHQLTIPMAKEICMLQRNEKGKMARQYFIALEAQWNSPDAVMARALKLADKQIADLRLINNALTAEQQTAQPKADSFTAADYLKAARLVANCPKAKLPYVLGLLESGGWKIQNIVIGKPSQVLKPNRIPCAEYLSERMAELKISQSDLARATGISRKSISHYSRGIRRPDIATYQRLIDALDDLECAREQ